MRTLNFTRERDSYNLFTPDTSLASRLRTKAKQLLVGWRTCAPSQKHFVHFTAGIIVNYPACVKEEGKDKRGENTGAGLIDALQNHVKEV